MSREMKQDKTINIGKREDILVEPIKNCKSLKKIKLLRVPIIVSSKKRARPSPHEAHKTLPTINQLTNINYYNRIFYPEDIKEASKQLNKNQRKLAEIVVSSNPHININPINKNGHYERAFQFLRREKSNGSFIVGKGALRYDGSLGYYNKFFGSLNRFNGLAEVVLFSEEADFEKYFPSPLDIPHEDIPVMKDIRKYAEEMTNTPLKLKYEEKFMKNDNEIPLSMRIFEEFFRSNLNSSVLEIEDDKKVKIKSVLLSPIKIKSKIIDEITRVGFSSTGRFLLGASYLF